MQISGASVDFWESELDVKEMKLMHAEKLYPPSIEMIVQLSNQVQSQQLILSVRFEGCASETEIPQFQFILPIGMYMYNNIIILYGLKNDS